MIVQEFGVFERHEALMVTRELAQHTQLDQGQVQELKRLENLLCTNDPSDLAAITRELRTIGRQLDERLALFEQVERFNLLVEGAAEEVDEAGSAAATELATPALAAPALAAPALATPALASPALAVPAVAVPITRSVRARVEQAQQLVALVAMTTVIGAVLLVGGLILLLSPGKLFIATPLAVAALVLMFKALGLVARQHRLECEVLERTQVRSLRAELVAQGVRGAALDSVEQDVPSTLATATAGGGFSLDRALRGRS